MRRILNITLSIIVLAASSSTNAARGTFTVSASTIASYSLSNFDFSPIDFSPIPFTEDGSIKQYKLDDFIVNKNEKRSDLEGMGLIVFIHKYKSEGRTFISVIYE